MWNSIDFYKGTFLHVTPVRIIVPCKKIGQKLDNNNVLIKFDIHSKTISFIQDFINWWFLG